MSFFYVQSHSTQRRTAIVGAVLGLHAVGIWALQSGAWAPAPLPTPVPDEVIAATIISPMNMPVAKALPPQRTPAPTPPATPPAPTPPVRKPTPAPQPPSPRAAAPQPTTTTAPAPAEPAPLAVATDAPAAAPPATTATATAPATAPSGAAATNAPASSANTSPAAAAAAPTIELPSSNAAYLNNPKPAYPSVSKRMGEQGKVVMRVLVGADGVPQKVELKTSSGFDRLDRQALEAVQQWRFVPGKRNGVPEAMWNLVPLAFVIE